MRILLLITDLQRGGTPTVVRELAVRLAAHAQVQVACLAGWGPVADELRDAGIPTTALNASGPLDFRVIWRLSRLIRRENFDIVFSFLLHANAAAAAATLLRRRVRLIQSIQTTQPTPLWHWVVQRVVQRFAQRIVVPTESVAEMAGRRRRVRPETIAIIPNAVEPADFQSLAGRDPRQPVRQIGFLGRLDPVKRIGDLVSAMSLLEDDFHLHIFGEGPQRPSLETQIRAAGLQQRSTLHGQVSRPQEALGQIDLLALPSQAEGFGLVLIEAMAAGIPVVAADAPGIRDVVRHQVTGLLFPVGDPATLAGAITRIADDEILRQSLIAVGREEVYRRFQWSVVLPQYLATLGAVARQRPL